MTEANEELQGLTLTVYMHVVRRGKPVGPRDVMKGANLSSPSVAYRHLQKLEDAGYLSKNEYGEYTVKRKANIRGYIWLGHRLFPKLWLYSSLFLGILIVELYVFIIHFYIETYEFKVFFILLTVITGLAFAVFTIEGLLFVRRRNKTSLE